MLIIPQPVVRIQPNDPARSTESLQAAVVAIRKRFGAEALTCACQLQRSILRIATGLNELDELLQGGIPAGRITEVVGRMGSGAHSVALTLLSGGQAAGRLGVYVDPNQTFDPVEARHSGVDLEALLVVRSTPVAVGLEIVEGLVQREIALAAVVDLTNAPHIPDLHRLERLLLHSTSAVVLLRDADAGLCPQTSLRLQVEWAGWVKRSSDIRGCQSRVSVVKHKSGPVGQSTVLALAYAGWADGAAA